MGADPVVHFAYKFIKFKCQGPGLVILVETSSSNGTNGIHFTLFSPLCSPGLRASKECKVVLDDRGQSEEKSMICLRNLKFSNF